MTAHAGVAVALPRGGSGAYARPPGGSSAHMRPPFFEPPLAKSPLGSAKMSPVPNSSRSLNETAKMAQSTDRTPQTSARDAVEHIRAIERRSVNTGIPKTGNPVLRIFIETVLIFSVCLLGYFIYRIL